MNGITVGRVYEVLCWGWAASELLLQVVTRTGRSSGTVRDRGSLFVVLGGIYTAIWAATWYGDTHGHNMLGGGAWMTVAALAILVAGLVVRWTAILTLGVSFSTNVAIHRTQRLQTAGLYRWMRHPSYTGMLISMASIGVMERNWVSLAIAVALPALALAYRIHVEEVALTEAFGEEYRAYCRLTKRLVPGVY